MPDKKEKPYPLEFKESAVKLAIGSTNPIAQTARELGINVNTVSSSGQSNTLSYNKKDKGLDDNEITKLFWFFSKPTNRSMVKVETR